MKYFCHGPRPIPAMWGPVFEAQLLRKLGARGVVYFTDGEGP